MELTPGATAGPPESGTIGTARARGCAFAKPAMPMAVGYAQHALTTLDGPGSTKRIAVVSGSPGMHQSRNACMVPERSFRT